MGGGRVIDVVDEVLSRNPNAGGLAINWRLFGSSGEIKADYSRGVLERFTKRAHNNWSENNHVKTIANPRAINFINNPHYKTYFEGIYSVNEKGSVVTGPFNEPETTDKIVINHYHCKSLEEYRTKKSRGIADKVAGTNYSDAQFEALDRNDEFDDGILKYRATQAENFRLPDKSRANERLLNALMKNLSPTLLPNTPPEFYAGKMETFLTCRAVSAYLKPRITDAAQANYFEEASIKAILKSINQMTFSDSRLLIRDLPNLLRLSYPVVNELRKTLPQIILQMMDVMRLNNLWKDYVELDYLKDLLKE